MEPSDCGESSNFHAGDILERTIILSDFLFVLIPSNSQINLFSVQIIIASRFIEREGRGRSDIGMSELRARDRSDGTLRAMPSHLSPPRWIITASLCIGREGRERSDMGMSELRTRKDRSAGIPMPARVSRG
jgi:hypothetical protein